MQSGSSHLQEMNVAIIGLGLMGGSLALALKGKCKKLIGIDVDPRIVALACDKEVVDLASTSAETLLPEAEIVVFATPVRTILSLLKMLPSLHPGAPMVFDLGSTKTAVVQAMDALPYRFDPIGGHPMCGKERASLVFAEAGLYLGAPFALTALERSSSRARDLAQEIVLAIDAKPLWLDSRTHDRWVAATSHLPYLVANALAAVTPEEAAPMVGTGLRSTTRLAPSDLKMMMDILATNPENILQSLRKLIQRLHSIERAIVEGEDAVLEEILSEGVDQYKRIVN